MEKYQKKWSKPSPDCAPILVSGRVLDFDKLAGPFMLFIIGLIMAFFVIFVEMVMAKVAQNSMEKDPKFHFKASSF